MRVLFNNHTPFSLAHGGAQIQTECTMQALSQIGVPTDHFRWWDDRQSGEILHQVGVMPLPVMRRARERGWRVVQTPLLTETCNRSDRELFVRRLGVSALLAVPGLRQLHDRLPWQAYRECDLTIVGLEAERMVLERVYGVPPERVAVVPLGLSETFLNPGPPVRTEPHLICTGTIGPLKNSLELARLAVAAQTPMLFVGKPFDYASAYWKEFHALVDDRFVKHQPHVGNDGLVDWLRRARGYVLMSRNENWSLAAHEAAACGLPMLLPDQRWSRERFGDQAAYFSKKLGDASVTALRKFYDQCPSLGAPKVRLLSWREVAEQLRGHYERLLAGRARS